MKLPYFCQLGRLAFPLALWMLAQTATVPARGQDSSVRGRSPVEVASILAAMRSAASRLTSVEFKSIAVLNQFQGDEVAETVTSTTRFAMKGTKHRISVDTENTTGRSPLHHVIAFDGEKHQLLTERAGVLELSSTPAEKPLHHPPPILIPYSFIFEAEDRPDFATLLNHSNWEDLASQARLGDRATIDGHECEVLTFTKKLGPMETMVTVHAAMGLDYFPLRMDLASEGMRSSVAVVAHEVVETQNGPVVVATQIRSHSRDAGDVTLQTIEVTIQPDTLQLNHEILDSFFTLQDPAREGALAGDLADTRLRATIDGDTGEVVRHEPPIQRERRGAGRVILIATSVVLLCALGAIVLLRRRIRRQTV